MYYIAVFRTVFLRLIFHSFELYSYSYPNILTLKICQSVVLKYVPLLKSRVKFVLVWFLVKQCIRFRPLIILRSIFSVKVICKQILARLKVTVFSSEFNITNSLSKLKTLSSDYVVFQVEHFLCYTITLKHIKIAIAVKLVI